MNFYFRNMFPALLNTTRIIHFGILLTRLNSYPNVDYMFKVQDGFTLNLLKWSKGGVCSPGQPAGPELHTQGGRIQSTCQQTSEYDCGKTPTQPVTLKCRPSNICTHFYSCYNSVHMVSSQHYCVLVDTRIIHPLRRTDLKVKYLC